MFSDVKFMSAYEKELLLKQWTTFIKNGFRFENFTKRIYNHLHLHCSFIAHYSIGMFYQTYFRDIEDTALFLRQFDRDWNFISREGGTQYWYRDPNYNDINEAMALVVDRYKRGIYEEADIKRNNRLINQAKELLEEAGVSYVINLPTQGGLR